MEHRATVDIDLKAYLRKLKRHWLPVTTIIASTVILASLSTLLIKPTYTAEGKLRFKVDRSSSLAEIGESSGELRPLVSTQNPLSTEIEVIYSKPLLQQLIYALELKGTEGEKVTPQEIQSRLSVSIIGGTDVLKLAYESPDPKEAAAVVNTLMGIYIRSDIDNSRFQAVKAKEFIAQQIPQTERVVRQAEEALSQFKEQNQIIDLAAETETSVTEIALLDRSITETQAEMNEALARLSSLQGQVGLSTDDAISVSNLSQSSELQEVLRNLQRVERELAVAREVYQEGFPTVVNLESQRKALESLWIQKSRGTGQGLENAPKVRVELGDPERSPIKDFLEAEVQQRSISERLKTLFNKRLIYEKRIKNFPKLQPKLHELERQVLAAQSTYEKLLNKLQELQVTENENASNAQVIEQAAIPNSSSIGQKRAVILLGGILLGTVFGTAAIPILDKRYQARKRSESPDPILDYPLWGIIPPSEEQVWDNQQSLPSSSASIRAIEEILQRQPQILHPESTLTTIVVTGLELPAGKSTIAANLAKAMAESGHKVLLIDADLGNSKQHKIFGFDNTLGLSNVIKDTSVRFDEIKMVLNSPMKNLDILTSGFSPSNPFSILHSDRMSQLMQYFSWCYDMVIIDTPPLLDSRGSKRLGELADGVLLVTPSQKLRQEEALKAQEIIDNSEQNILGIIVSQEGSENNVESDFSASKTLDLNYEPTEKRHKVSNHKG